MVVTGLDLVGIAILKHEADPPLHVHRNGMLAVPFATEASLILNKGALVRIVAISCAWLNPVESEDRRLQGSAGDHLHLVVMVERSREADTE